MKDTTRPPRSAPKARSKQADPALRGSLEGWLEAAYRTFIETGIDAVRIMPLAERLRLSRTSFYWFFKDREALLEALLERWRAKNTQSLVKQTKTYAETICEAVLNVFDCWFDAELFDAKFEFAMRGWAQQSAPVTAEVVAADRVRTMALKEMFMRFGFDPLSADVRARTSYLVQIGYISMNTQEDRETRMTRIPSYCRIFTGDAPTRQELKRFYARHHFEASERMLVHAMSAEKARRVKGTVRR